jgi:TP901-1 family phage major tail protein
MPAVSGVAFIIKVNTGTDAVPAYTKVAGQINATLNRSADDIDTTTKDSNGWAEGEPILKSWGIEFDGLLVEDDAGYKALEDAYMSDAVLKMEVVMPSGKKYDGNAYLTDFPIEGPYDDSVTYSGTLKGTGPLTPTPAA